MPAQQKENYVLPKEDFQKLFDSLNKKNYKILGPKLADNAIIYDEISSVCELPVGYTDEQDAGKYKLKKRSDKAYFGYVIGPHSWKNYLFPPREKLYEAKLDNNGFEIVEEKADDTKLAFIGVRACEISAILVQDKVFIQGQFVHPLYKARRENTFIIAVNCTQAGKTCFCVSMNTGPHAQSNYDIALTEIIEDSKHFFLLQTGSKLGAEIVSELNLNEAEEEILEKKEKLKENATKQMSRALDTKGIKELLYNNYEHERWDDVAKRCLSCANCTMVCPTCFCSTVEDVTDLSGQIAERWQTWDSCFTLDHSYIHGGNIRSSARSRYRQWMTHKLATWIDQFGTSGCVGCGRCITWCPVGIDITEEVSAIRKSKGDTYGNT